MSLANKNLALVTPKFRKGEGQGRVNYQIVQEALRRGFQVTLIADQIAEDLRQHPQVTSVLLPVAHWPTVLLQNQVFAWRSARWLKAHRGAVDVILVNGFITWAAGDVNAVHFVHTAWRRSPVHSARLRRDFYGLYQWFYSAVNARLERKAFAAAKVLVAVSERVKQELVAIGIPPGRIQVVINGVDLEEFRPGAVSRSDLGLPEVVPLALFAGDLRTPRKNLDTVLRALVEAPGLHLAVAGAVEGSPYPALSDRLGLAPRVHFLGYRRDVALLMRAADFLVFPSRYEACSLVLLEALASGLPVITAVTAGGAEVVTADCGVVLPDPDDVQALTAALHRLVSNPERRASMRKAARLVAEQHSWSRMAGAYLEICQRVLAPSGAESRAGNAPCEQGSGQAVDIVEGGSLRADR